MADLRDRFSERGFGDDDNKETDKTSKTFEKISKHLEVIEKNTSEKPGVRNFAGGVASRAVQGLALTNPLFYSLERMFNISSGVRNLITRGGGGRTSSRVSSEESTGMGTGLADPRKGVAINTRAFENLPTIKHLNAYILYQAKKDKELYNFMAKWSARTKKHEDVSTKIQNKQENALNKLFAPLESIGKAITLQRTLIAVGVLGIIGLAVWLKNKFGKDVAENIKDYQTKSANIGVSQNEMAKRIEKTAKITSGFGGGHKGIDIGSTQGGKWIEGSPIRSICTGKVYATGYDVRETTRNARTGGTIVGWGYWAQVEATGGFTVKGHPDATAVYVLYAHMKDIAVEKGKTVNQGTLIGHLGNTGGSTAPHLHIEIKVKDPDGTLTIVDPQDITWGVAGAKLSTFEAYKALSSAQYGAGAEKLSTQTAIGSGYYAAWTAEMKKQLPEQYKQDNTLVKKIVSKATEIKKAPGELKEVLDKSKELQEDHPFLGIGAALKKGATISQGVTLGDAATPMNQQGSVGIGGGLPSTIKFNTDNKGLEVNKKNSQGNK